MSRGIGEFELIQSEIPEWLAVVFALLTQLGDIWFLAILLTALYWFDAASRDDIAIVVGLWIAGMGLYKGLKEVFRFPRPDRPLLDPELLPWLVQPLYEATAFSTGYGFPSGHAVNTTVVYFALAYVLRIGSLRTRVAGAAAIVATVSFTRVALGVHYLVDVVVGFAAGAALLLVAYGLVRRFPADRASVTFALAIPLGAFFVLTSGAHPDSLLVLATALGAFAGWQVVMLGRQLALLTRLSDAIRPLFVRGTAAAVAVAPLLVALEGFSFASPLTLAGLTGLAAAGVILLPAVRRSHRVHLAVARVRNRLRS